MDIPYTLAKTRTGKIRVKYVCPGCKEKLESELSEAGSTDICPSCQVRFVVPGEAKRIEVESQISQQLAERHQQERQAALAAQEVEFQLATQAKEDRHRMAVADMANQERINLAHEHALRVPANTKYPALEAYMHSMRLVGYGLTVLWVCVPGAVMIAGAIAQEKQMVTSGVMMFFAGALVVLPLAISFFIGAQLVQLALDARADLAKLVQRK